VSESPDLSPSRATNSSAPPSWAGAFSGLWLLNWRSQLTLRQLPGRVGVLLVLPFLIYITMALSNRTDRDLRRFLRDLERAQIPATQQAGVALKGILDEEMKTEEKGWQPRAGETPEARTQRLRDQILAGDTRILSRARAVLDDRQFSVFQNFEENNRDNALRQLSDASDPWSRTKPFYYWLISFYFLLILPLTCVRACGPIIRDELQADTLGFLITRPVGRARLLVLKYASQVVWLQIVLLVETLLIFAAGAALEIPALGSLLPLVLAVQILAVPAWSALGLLLGQVTTRYMAAALLYGTIVEMGIGRIPTNINSLSIVRHLKTLLGQNPAAEGFYNWPAGNLTTAIAALIVAPLIFLSISAVLFNLVEYHHASEMQK
jgi:hypothetical protein